MPAKQSKKSGVALRFPPHSKKRGRIASGKTFSDWPLVLLLRRLRRLPKREIASRRRLWRSRLGGSLGGPARSHRSRELLATFWREIEFPLLFLEGRCACRFCLRFCC